MNEEQFREGGRKVLDFITDHLKRVLSDGARVVPDTDIEPGFLWKSLPDDAPERGEPFDTIMEDFKSVFVPRLHLQQSPNFYYVYPSGFSLVSLLGDLASHGSGATFVALYYQNPAGTELELRMIDWLGRMLKLPRQFLWGLAESYPTGGGGILQNSGTESILVTILAAREEAIEKQMTKTPEGNYHSLLAKLVAYTSDQANFAFDRSAKTTAVKFRKIDSDGNFSLDTKALEATIKADKEAGLIPFYLCATLGTTGNCAMDDVGQLGPICEREGLWLHVDAAYAGAACICPEFRYFLDGVEYAESININPHKWLLTTWNCSALWVKRKTTITSVLKSHGSYLNASKDRHFEEDLMDWEINAGRYMRAVKLWFVIRSYGVEGLQSYIRRHVRLAKMFASFLSDDDRFKLERVCMGIVTFCLKGTDQMNRTLLTSINREGRIYFSSAVPRDHLVLRFAVTSEFTNDKHVISAWKVITEHAQKILSKSTSRL